MSRIFDWFCDLPIWALLGTIFAAILFFAFVIVAPLAHYLGAEMHARCDAVYGHLYTYGRTTLCLTDDNRIIEHW